jgi:hypothetical protein
MRPAPMRPAPMRPTPRLFASPASPSISLGPSCWPGWPGTPGWPAGAPGAPGTPGWPPAGGGLVGGGLQAPGVNVKRPSQRACQCAAGKTHTPRMPSSASIKRGNAGPTTRAGVRTKHLLAYVVPSAHTGAKSPLHTHDLLPLGPPPAGGLGGVCAPGGGLRMSHASAGGVRPQPTWPQPAGSLPPLRMRPRQAQKRSRLASPRQQQSSSVQLATSTAASARAGAHAASASASNSAHAVAAAAERRQEARAMGAGRVRVPAARAAERVRRLCVA